MKAFILFMSIVLTFHLSTKSQTIQKTIEEFGAKGDGVTNDYPAFVAAAKSGSQVIKLKAKTYLLDNQSGNRLQSILVASNVSFVGLSGTFIKFTYNGLPLFTFTNSDRGGIKNVNFVYAGRTQIKSDYPVSDFFAKIGIKNMGLPPSEISTVIFATNCNNFLLKNLSFQSAHPNDTLHCIGACVNIKANEVAPVSTTKGLIISNIIFKDCDIGLFISGQENFTISNLESERRFGNQYFPPGHIIYFTGSPGGLLNNHGITKNIIDYGNPINLAGRCLATLAPKWMDNCTVDNVITLHPEGIAQTFLRVTNCKFKNLTWIKNDDIRPAASFMNFSGTDSIINNTFDKILIFSKGILPNIGSMGLMRDNTFTNIYAYIDLKLKDYQNGIGAFLTIDGQHNTFDKTFIEVANSSTNDRLNTIVFCRDKSTSNKANVVMNGIGSRDLSSKMTKSTVNRGTLNNININNNDLSFNDLNKVNQKGYSAPKLLSRSANLTAKLNKPHIIANQQILFVKFKQNDGTFLVNSYLVIRSLNNKTSYRVIPLKIETQKQDPIIIQSNYPFFSVSINKNIYNQDFHSSSLSYSWINADQIWSNLNSLN